MQVQPSEGSYPHTDDSDSEEEEDEEEEEEQQMLDGLRRSTTNQRRNAYKVQRKVSSISSPGWSGRPQQLLLSASFLAA